MGLQDRDYMKRDVRPESKRKLQQPRHAQKNRKTVPWKIILISITLLGGLFLIMDKALKPSIRIEEKSLKPATKKNKLISNKSIQSHENYIEKVK